MNQLHKGGGWAAWKRFEILRIFLIQCFFAQIFIQIQGANQRIRILICLIRMQLPHAVTAYNTLVLPMKFQAAYIHMPARPFRQHRAALVFLPNDTRRIQANMSIGINVAFFINQFPEIFFLLIKIKKLCSADDERVAAAHTLAVKRKVGNIPPIHIIECTLCRR